MQDLGFQQINQISSEIQDVKENLETMQEAQRSILSTIEENKTMMTQVVNHIGNAYHDGRLTFLPPQYIQDKNQHPSEHSANSTLSSQNTDMMTMLKTLANEIKSIKSMMSELQQ